MYTDSEECDGGDSAENDKNIESKFHRGFVSGWDDDDESIEEEDEEECRESPEKKILRAAENGNAQLVSELLVMDSKLVNATDKDGYTPLHRAAYNNHLEILNILLEHGADCNAETSDKWTPLHSACHWNNVACVEKLLSLEVNVNVQTKGGITPLHLAATNCVSPETMQSLLLHPDIDISLKNKSNETAYEIAIRRSRFGKLFELVEPCFNYI